MLSVVDNNAYVIGYASTNITYTYILNGKAQSYTSRGMGFTVEEGGFGLRYGADGSVKSMKQLEEISITSISGYSASGKAKDSQSSVLTSYSIDPDADFYLKKGDDYYPISPSQINDEDYNIKGYLDKTSSKTAGLIRVIVAQ